jgi:hypothetical protein
MNVDPDELDVVRERLVTAGMPVETTRPALDASCGDRGSAITPNALVTLLLTFYRQLQDGHLLAAVELKNGDIHDENSNPDGSGLLGAAGV